MQSIEKRSNCVATLDGPPPARHLRFGDSCECARSLVSIAAFVQISPNSRCAAHQRTRVVKIVNDWQRGALQAWLDRKAHRCRRVDSYMARNIAKVRYFFNFARSHQPGCCIIFLNSPLSISFVKLSAPPIKVPLTNTIGNVGQPDHSLSALRSCHMLT